MAGEERRRKEARKGEGKRRGKWKGKVRQEGKRKGKGKVERMEQEWGRQTYKMGNGEENKVVGKFIHPC